MKQRVCENLRPEKVFYYFEEISKIPHGSGNTKQISDYLAGFAKDRNLEYVQDEIGNVIMICPATKGYEEEEPLIIQGHMDMVCVQKADCKKDMKTEGLDLAIDKDDILAIGTSLGGDDGIAVAMGLALADMPELQHPRLEIVITVDEETGMFGAHALDASILKGKYLLNLDSEEEGIFLTSCAGGARVKCKIAIQWEENKKWTDQCLMRVTGLMGGHSGVEIHKKRGNANKLLGRTLQELKKEGISFSLTKAEGGVADNAIASKASAHIVFDGAERDRFLKTVKKIEDKLKQETKDTDPEFEIRIESAGLNLSRIWSEKSLNALIGLINELPDGVQKMSQDIPGLVQTSLNLGVLHMEEDQISLDHSVRSSVVKERDELIEKMEEMTLKYKGTLKCSGAYPAWEYRKDSVLRQRMIRAYEELTGKKATIQAIHAGLECGILAGKIEDLDAVSLGPNMKDIHTAEERLSISSVQRTWDLLLKVIEEKEK